MRVKLTKQEIDEVFDNAKEQADYVIGLYKLVLGKAGIDFSKVKKLKSWPCASRKVSDYIIDKAVKFDREHHPDVIPGGAWLNWGFSTGCSLPDDSWEVEVPDDIV